MSLDDIAALWAQDPRLPMAEIGSRLGVSRSAVAGQIARARRKKDPRFGPRQPGSESLGRKPGRGPEAQGRPLAAKSGLSAVMEPLVTEGRPDSSKAAAGPPRPRLLVDLEWADCRWPIGSAPDGRHLFCGRAQAPGRPYCPSCDLRHRALRVSPSATSSASTLLRAPSSAPATGQTHARSPSSSSPSQPRSGSG